MGSVMNLVDPQTLLYQVCGKEVVDGMPQPPTWRTVHDLCKACALSAQASALLSGAGLDRKEAVPSQSGARWGFHVWWDRPSSNGPVWVGESFPADAEGLRKALALFDRLELAPDDCDPAGDRHTYVTFVTVHIAWDRFSTMKLSPVCQKFEKTAELDIEMSDGKTKGKGLVYSSPFQQPAKVEYESPNPLSFKDHAVKFAQFISKQYGPEFNVYVLVGEHDELVDVNDLEETDVRR